MKKNRVFVSLDEGHDKQYKFMIQEWDPHPEFEFVFKKEMPNTIDTQNIGRIKTELSETIDQTTHTLFIIGKYSNQPHELQKQIGFLNWMNFEAYQSMNNGNYLAVLQLDEAYTIPRELELARYWRMNGFSQRHVYQVLNDSFKR